MIYRHDRRTSAAIVKTGAHAVFIIFVLLRLSHSLTLSLSAPAVEGVWKSRPVRGVTVVCVSSPRRGSVSGSGVGVGVGGGCGGGGGGDGGVAVVATTDGNNNNIQE